MSTQTRHEKAQHTDIMSEGVARRLAAIGHIPTGAAREVIASHETLRAQVAHLTAQRDALLEALQSLTQLIRNGVDLYGAKQLEWLTQKNSFARAERAIAQATGNGQ